MPAAARAVVFDVGNVLYAWDIRALYAQLIDDPARLDWFCANVVTNAWHFQHDHGRPAAETTAELIAQYPAERDLIEAYVPRWLDTITGPVPGMIELAHELADVGVPLYAITNFSAEFWERFRPTAPVFDRFRAIVVSGEERMVKPDPAIYRLALERFALAPGEGLFIDDQQKNTAAAEQNGFAAHHFTDAATARARLVREGLLPG